MIRLNVCRYSLKKTEDKQSISQVIKGSSITLITIDDRGFARKIMDFNLGCVIIGAKQDV